MYYRYTVDELSNAISRMTDINPNEITNEISITWLLGDGDIFLSPDCRTETEAETFLTYVAPECEDITGRGRPESMDYSLPRLSLVEHLIECLPRDSQIQFWEKKRHAQGDKETLEMFYGEIVEIIQENGLTEDQLAKIKRVTFKASLALRFCWYKFNKIPPPFKIDIQGRLIKKRTTGPNEGEKPKGQLCYLFLKNLVQAGLYEPRAKEAPFAAGLIKEIFELDIEESSIANYIRDVLNSKKERQKLF